MHLIVFGFSPVSWPPFPIAKIIHSLKDSSEHIISIYLFIILFLLINYYFFTSKTLKLHGVKKVKTSKFVLKAVYILKGKAGGLLSGGPLLLIAILVDSV